MKKLPVQLLLSRVTIDHAASAMISGLRHWDIALSPPSISIAAVAIVVRGQNAFTAMPSSRSSSAMPRTHMLMPYFAIVYATWFLNHFGDMLSGGELLRMCGFSDLRRCGRHACEHANVPRVLM